MFWWLWTVRKWTLGLIWKRNQSRNEGFGMKGTKMKITPNFKVSKCTLVLASWLGRCSRVSNVAIWSRIPHCLMWIICRERNAWIVEGWVDRCTIEDFILQHSIWVDKCFGCLRFLLYLIYLIVVLFMLNFVFLLYTKLINKFSYSYLSKRRSVF